MSRINGQTLIYLAVGAAVLLVGLNSIRGSDSNDHGPGATRASGASGETSGGIRVGSGGRLLVVDVAGAVKRPGVYRFEPGARVVDAIARAGGLDEGAVVDGLNRAATLADGQQVVVPSTEAVATAGAGAGVPDAPISLGTATREQLEEVDGIGPVTAAKIIEFRDSQGGLGSVEELDQISGIGPVTMESLRGALSP